MTIPSDTGFPRIDSVGLDGLLVRFGETLDEPANRAALAFRAALERAGPDGVEECSTSLVSCYVRFDPLAVAPEDLSARLGALVKTQDWYAAALPEGRRLVTIPAVYGTDLAPQLAEAAAAAGMSEEEAITSLSQAQVRVTAIGFAPGQPYMGTLPEAWNIPRQTALTPQVPVGALVVAIRQLVLFSVSTPTGWRHVGQTAARLFQPESETPFLLRPGDEVRFPAVSRAVFERMKEDPSGGLTAEVLA
ncbi:5-oxoprolinase subunit B family protein [Pacificoceanicola onchidii]|uniref:5-oxoprolinase subunit B family protein n=1 Tax=Pacificoceanicola onchidii TaxID=2562685 RepID=UPI0010A42758|nr:carboxyltransferase domain-containing protein [Pacificoceanicola onchidii]